MDGTVQRAADAAVEALPETLQPESRQGRLAAFAIGLLIALGLAAALALALADLLGLLASPSRLPPPFTGPSQLVGMALVGVEEAGIPVPVPGDGIIMYAGHSVPRVPLAWFEVWAGTMVAVGIGSSLLFAAARRWGKGAVRGRLGEALHLTPERLERVEGWFRKWGLWTIILGRYAPGGRVPVTVAAAIFGVSYRAFLASLLVSSAVWVGAFICLGVLLGPKADSQVHAHRGISYLLTAAFVLAGVGYLAFRLVKVGRRGGGSG